MADFKINFDNAFNLQQGGVKIQKFEPTAEETPQIVQIGDLNGSVNVVSNDNSVIDDSLFPLLDSDGDGKITENDEIIKAIIDAMQDDDVETDKTDKTKETDKASQKDVSDLTPEEIENMDAEELVELYRSEVEREIFETKNASHITSNPIFLELVSKMSDEKLDEFMNMYKEKYPTTRTQDGALTFTSYETLLSNLMWGTYSVVSGAIDADTAFSALERLKKYCPQLNTEDGNAVRQWA